MASTAATPLNGSDQPPGGSDHVHARHLPPRGHPLCRPPVPAPARLVSGLTEGIAVETAAGWQPVETLRRGDRVHTLDGGLRGIVAIDRNWLLPGEGAWLVHVPGGALDNCADLLLLPRQQVMFDILPEDDMPDALVAMVAAAALEGLRGITRRAILRPLEAITLIFAEEEAIYANSGLRLHCPGVDTPAEDAEAGDFTRLDLIAARELIRRRDACLAGGIAC
ncbi:Hint domain-containing protein [Paracoccaceae bacterium Fryx2]|nr:Hint domain-containing protein [Paracoccaceae bacterium Fryx2]